MGIVLSLLAAFGYGSSDFLAGLAGRRGPASAVALLAEPCGLVAGLVGLWVVPWTGPSGSSLAWGAASGLGSGLGVLALYRGLTIGRMSVVAPLAGVLTAAVPAVVGLGLGDRPSLLSLVGIFIALPAVLLVSRSPRGDTGAQGRSGIPEAVVAGLSFALLFIALDRAGTRSGTWPLVSGQTVAVLLIAAAAIRARPEPAVWAKIAPLALIAGVLGGTGNVLFLLATSRGELAVVAVLASLYPAVTVGLALLGLGERITRTAAAGLGLAVLAVVLISL